MVLTSLLISEYKPYSIISTEGPITEDLMWSMYIVPYYNSLFPFRSRAVWEQEVDVMLEAIRY
jgi:hypothetical protein